MNFLLYIMPEGVEIKLQLEKLKNLKNQQIQSIEILSGRYTRHGDPQGFKEFKKSLPEIIQSIHQKGKFIYFKLSNEWYILITLGMTGKIVIHKTPEKHDHIQFKTPKYTFYFNDLRNFGTIIFTQNKDILDKKLQKLGYDPLQNKTTFSQFEKQLDKFNQSKQIGEILKDQKFFSGIGNYLRSDILFCAKIHPKKILENLTYQNKKLLHKCIYQTMQNSYSKQKQKEHKFLVYKQKLSPLGNPISKFKDSSGRYIWFDEKVQSL